MVVCSVLILLVKKVPTSRFLDHCIPTVGCRRRKEANAAGLPMGWRALDDAIISMEFGPGMMIDKIAGCERMSIPLSGLRRLGAAGLVQSKYLRGSAKASRGQFATAARSSAERSAVAVSCSRADSFFSLAQRIHSAKDSRGARPKSACTESLRWRVHGTGGAATSRCSGDEIASLFRPAAGPFDE
jgi:hypothetical protein